MVMTLQMNKTKGLSHLTQRGDHLFEYFIYFLFILCYRTEC